MNSHGCQVKNFSSRVDDATSRTVLVPVEQADLNEIAMGTAFGLLLSAKLRGIHEIACRKHGTPVRVILKAI
jgi:hypothetical protein